MTTATKVILWKGTRTITSWVSTVSTGISFNAGSPQLPQVTPLCATGAGLVRARLRRHQAAAGVAGAPPPRRGRASWRRRRRLVPLPGAGPAGEPLALVLSALESKMRARWRRAPSGERALVPRRALEKWAKESALFRSSSCELRGRGHSYANMQTCVGALPCHLSVWFEWCKARYSCQ